MAMALMIWCGQLPTGQAVPNQQAVQMLKYWLTVMGLAGVLMILALFDVLDGVRALRG